MTYAHAETTARSRCRRRALAALAGLAALGVLAAKPAAADYIEYSGTTVGGPRWNRPIANGLLPPTTLSGAATNVAYQAQTFTVATSGLYDFTSVGTSPVDWDNYTFLYQGTFNPATPLTNAVIGNDDSNFIIGLSGFQGVSLTAGQSYTFVTTGFANSDAGAFQNTIAQQVVFQTGTTVGGPTWEPFGDGDILLYSVVAFTVSTTGLYAFQSTAGFDQFTALYENAFNPSSPDDNLLNVNDDNPIIGLSGFLGQPLTAGVTYFFVTSGLFPEDFGQFSNSYSGPGTLTIVPEPATIVSLAIGAAGILGLTAARRRRRPA